MKRAEEIKPLSSGIICCFPFLSVKKSGLCPPQVCNMTIDWIGYGLALEKQAGGKAKYEAAFQSFEFSKKPRFTKNFELMQPALRARGFLNVNFSFRQETF